MPLLQSRSKKQEFTQILSRVLNQPAMLPAPEFGVRLITRIGDELILTRASAPCPLPLRCIRIRAVYPSLELALRRELGRPECRRVPSPPQHPNKGASHRTPDGGGLRSRRRHNPTSGRPSTHHRTSCNRITQAGPHRHQSRGERRGRVDLDGFRTWYRFIHNALPELSLGSVDASTTFLGKRLACALS